MGLKTDKDLKSLDEDYNEEEDEFMGEIDDLELD